jgi:hypothetical protein
MSSNLSLSVEENKKKCFLEATRVTRVLEGVGKYAAMMAMWAARREEARWLVEISPSCSVNKRAQSGVRTARSLHADSLYDRLTQSE